MVPYKLAAVDGRAIPAWPPGAKSHRGRRLIHPDAAPTGVASFVTGLARSFAELVQAWSIQKCIHLKKIACGGTMFAYVDIR
jgi:hypothetical protein